MTTDHAALCRKLLAALIETREAASALARFHQWGEPWPEALNDWSEHANAAIREAQEALR